MELILMDMQRFYFDFGEVVGHVDAKPDVSAIIQAILDEHGESLRQRVPVLCSAVELLESFRHARAYPYDDGHMVAFPNKCYMEETKPLAEYLALLQ